MTVADELLLSLADGELDAETAAKLRQAIAADPQLQERYAVFAETAVLLRETCDPGPAPDRLLAAIHAVTAEAEVKDPVIVPFATRKSAARQPIFWGAMAASLVIGVMLGTYQRSTAPGTTAVAEGLAYASLPTGSEQEAADGSTVRVLGSYQTDEGLCRDIRIETAAHVRHDVMCKASEDWQLALSLTAPKVQGYVPASDALTSSLDGFLNAIGAGSALSAAEEKAALALP